MSTYEKDVSIIKKIGKRYQYTLMKSCRVKGFEDINKRRMSRNVNNKKLENNVARAKSTIRQYALCNEWEWFVTLTLDGKKHDRFKYEVIREIVQDINKYNNAHRDNKIRFVLIPERHSNGAWHVHGLMSNIPDLRKIRKEDFTSFNKYMQQKIPDYVRKNFDKLYVWERYTEKFGYNLFDPIRDSEAIANYVIKYCTKDLASQIIKKELRLYYCSKGLKKAELIKKGISDKIPQTWNYQNDYCKIAWLDNIDEYKQTFVQLDYNSRVRKCQTLKEKNRIKRKLMKFEFHDCQISPFDLEFYKNEKICKKLVDLRKK